MKEVAGQKFNRLTILQRTRKTAYGHWYVDARCDCGKVTNAKLYHITSGVTQSCGCLAQENRTTHGMWRTQVYRAWQNMKGRVNHTEGYAKERYAGRGIGYVPEWESFEAFYEDMGDCLDGQELDRIDNDKGYCKENCRWTDRTVQSRNTVLIRSNNTSGYRGVGKRANRWRAYISVNGRYVHLGQFDTPEAAARAYNARAAQLPGFPLNEIPA